MKHPTPHDPNTAPGAVDAAVAAWREAERAHGSQDGRLSAQARTRILAAARRVPADEPRPLAALFLPLRRLVFAGVLPAAAMTALLAALILPGLWQPAGQAGSGAPVGLHVSKQDGHVVIRIANGGGIHHVRRSTDPRGQRGQVFATGGAFRDRLESGSELVFYRID